MDWLNDTFSLDSWGDAIATFYDDSGLDTLVAGVSNLFGDGSIMSGVDNVFAGLGNAANGAVNFTLDGLFGTTGSLAGMTMESEDGISATIPGEAGSKGLIGNIVDWTEKNPTSAKLASGLISGAAQGFMANKALEQNQKQFDARIAAEQKALRDRYDYEVEAKAKDRSSSAQDYLKAYGAK